MKDALEYIKNTYNVRLNQKHQPVEIPNTTRETLAEMFCKLDYKLGAEIGVEEGIYSEILCKANPNLHLYSVDAWTAYDGYRDHVSQKKLDDIYAIAKEKLQPYDCELIKGFSVDVSKQFADESLDFVYLDANHEFTEVVNDIAAWERKVKVGGIVSGHDYILRKGGDYLMHVPYAINAYCSSYQVKPLFVLGSKDVRQGEKRDSTRSWFYVKQPRRPVVPGHNA